MADAEKKQSTPGNTAALPEACVEFDPQTDPPSPGKQMAERFLHGDVDAIWSASTSEMRRMFGSAGDLATFREDLLSCLGDEDAILSERIDLQAGHELYRRLSRWTRQLEPLELTIALDGAERITGILMQPQPIAVPSNHLDYRTKATLRLPVVGEWFVYWGGREIEDNYHAVDTGQRFALDFLIMWGGRSYTGDPSLVESYHCWGRPILAPAAGVVVRAVHSLPDQAIGASDPANPAGNHVVIDFGNDEYGFLAHLQQGSLRVATGDAVAAGQEIGLCGNSGNTSEPHLHFHMQTSPWLGEGKGLPAQFAKYWANGTLIFRGEPRKGEIIQTAE